MDTNRGSTQTRAGGRDRTKPADEALFAEVGVVESKLRPPRRRDGAVVREDLLRRIDSAAGRPVVLRAPAGFGKTTLLRQWVERDARPLAWVTVDGLDDDPIVLVRHLVAALGRIVPLNRAQLAVSTSVAPDATIVLGAFAADFAASTTPFVLALDDVHELTGFGAMELLDRLIDLVPDDCAVVIATRADPGVRRARRLVEGTLVELTVDDLRLDHDESATLVTRACPGLEEELLEATVGRCDGWPAGLALVGTALAGAADRHAVATGLTGADRLVADYLGDEVLGRMPAAEREFLVRTSVLETLTSPLCDAVLGTSGSHAVLEGLTATGNLFVAGFDDGGTWYRYHHLWRELLLAELRTKQHADESELRRRAARWLHARGLVDDAARQLLAAGDRRQAAALLTREIGACVIGGRAATLRRWQGWFDGEEIRTDPGLTLLAVWVASLTGDVEGLRHWLACLDDFPADEVLPDGTTLSVGRAAVEVLTGHGGTTASARAADVILELGPDGNAWWTTARLLGVLARHANGEIEDPDAAFGDVARDVTSDPAVLGVARAHRAILAARANRVADAGALAAQARETITAAGLADYPLIGIVHAAAALAAARAGDADAARQAAARTEGLLDRAAALSGRGHVHVNLVLAETWVHLGELGPARTRLRTAAERLVREPDAVVLAGWADELAGRLAAGGLGGGLELTIAERRVLEQLPTHQSLREIAELFFVSRNTVKTQTISVYRKLGVSNRSDAVVRARELGLLEPAATEHRLAPERERTRSS